MPAPLFRVSGVAVFALLVGSGLLGCRTSAQEGDSIDPAVAGTGGSRATSGRTGGTGGHAGTGGSAAAGTSGMAAAGTTGAAPAADAASTGDAITAPVADAAGDSTVAASDAIVPPTSDAAGDTAAPPMSSMDGGAPAGLAACYVDPKVIKICAQLAPACENCPPGGAPPKNKAAQACFDLIDKATAGKATDADCAKFAVDNNCKVDNGGNVCGSLDCNPTTCGGTHAPAAHNTCAAAKDWGDTSICAYWYTKCPCK